MSNPENTMNCGYDASQEETQSYMEEETALYIE